jgi:hypothetical protein
MIQKHIFKLVLLILLTSSNLYSHPWGGLVIDVEGNIYFSFICPLVDDNHYACVWKIDSDLQISEVLKSNRSPSDIILTKSPSGIIFAAERTGQHPNYSNRVWRINNDQIYNIIEFRAIAAPSFLTHILL